LLGESELVFPLAGDDADPGPSVHSATGRLRGRASGRLWAFLVVFMRGGSSHRSRADLLTLALFDIRSGEYGTSTEQQRHRRRSDRRQVSRGQLALSFQGSRGENSWRTQGGSEGSSVALSSTLHAIGVDGEGRLMELDLQLDARKPPVPLGGHATSFGAPGGLGTFQSGAHLSGTIKWGDEHEAVIGDCGWLAQRWTPRFLCGYGRRRDPHYALEWRQIQLGDGSEISVLMQFDQRRASRLMPPSLAIACGPNGEIAWTSDFQLERLSFVRAPHVLGLRDPPEGGSYFADRYRLCIPAWSLDLVSESLVAAPVHAFPIGYCCGPTRLTGTLDGSPVIGFGFDERTRVFCRDFEIVEVLHETLRHLPAAALPAGELDRASLAALAWDIDGFIGDGDQQGAIRHLNAYVRPAVETLAEPHCSHVRSVVDDAANALLRWWVRP
jgi:hypothetical protein